MLDLKSFLSDREWRPEPPPDEADVQQFLRIFKKSFPAEYLELIRQTDGGEGELALAPGWFVLDSLQATIDTNRDEFYAQEYPDLFIFGGNGGLELIAFDLRAEPWSVVTFDPIAGMESVERIATTFKEFLESVGIRNSDENGESG